ncbi:anti-sigma factor [Saccharothrix australiensis]|uniref:Regulator of SigK n=1 Tax=Saccharothrix australiensis TaxID=2072 RepID=A0A495W1L3_9PSEU|nr:anti-sigma factor [Saccharothrix australiensis]RKT54613.1 anti-sigma-K factor RskA [Saccharothrix australiensis]
MTDDTTRAEAHTLIGAYVLDAVTDAERLVFEEHLAACSGCARETAELRETTALLADPTAAEPPAGLRDRVLAEAARTPQPPPIARTPQPPPIAGAPPRRRAWSRRAGSLAAAAAVAVAVTLGVQGVVGDRQFERELQALRQVEADRGRLVELLAAPDAALARGEVAGGGTGTAVASAAKGQVLFLAHGLARLPEDRAYQLWLIDDAGPRSAGLLPPSGGQPGPLLAGGFTGGEAVGLTVEPRGGSDRPTTPPVVVLRVA